MTKEELKNYYADLLKKYPLGKIEIKQVLKDLDKLDEPQKVTVPQCVGDYIEHAKESEWDLEDLFEFVGDQECREIQKWFYSECNQDTLALAWINGYKVEEEKRYRVKIKGIDDSHCTLTHYKDGNRWIMGTITNNFLSNKLHTKEELEQAGFGWVFDCPGIEIEEVEG